MKIVTVVQARTGSVRLPGKALRTIGGVPMILHVMARASAMGFPTWMATGDGPQDDLLASEVHDAGYNVFRGSERDVLGRMRCVAAVAHADTVVRVTGDCPLFAPDLGCRLVEAWVQEKDASLLGTTDTANSGWPDGVDCEVFSYQLLEQIDTLLEPWHDQDREHVTRWMMRHCEKLVLPCEEDWRRVKISVDTLENFEQAKELSRLAQGTRWHDLREALFAMGLQPSRW